MSIHTGHRQRLKRRFRQEGLDNFDDLYILELLLFYCVPRQDTNLLAHKLLDRFGSVQGVLRAGTDELEQIEGVGENISTFLTLIHSLNRLCQIKQDGKEIIINSYEEGGELLFHYLRDRRNENVYLLSMDAKRKVLSCDKIGEGSVNSANISVRRIVEVALAANATVVILGHNHPSGLASPSVEDITTTQHIARALKAMDIELMDHIIVSDGEYISMTLSGLYRPGVDAIMR